MEIAFGIFNLILSFSPLFYAGYFFLIVKKKYTGKNINWDLEHGMKCYSCKVEIETLEDFTKRSVKDNLNLDDMKGLKICLSCKRDMKLSQTLGNKLTNLKLKYNKLLLNNYAKFLILSIALIMTFLLLDIFLRDYVYRTFFYIGQTFQLFYWYSFIQRWKLIHEKTQSIMTGF